MINFPLGFIIGIFLGSFVKATADRVIGEISLGGRSYCFSCKKTLAWYDLIPLFSYLTLRGKCRYCQKEIPKSNLVFELTLGLLLGMFFYFTKATSLIELLFGIFIISILSIVFWVDYKTGLIHDRITYPAIIISLAFLVTIALSLGDLNPLLWSFISGLGLASFFLLLIIITRGKGMGGGDVKYVFLLGLFLGFPKVFTGVFLAFLIGAVFSILLIIFGRKKFGQTIPFGPFLSIGAYLALLWGEQILALYLNSFKV
ncbi:MAG: prepilin peptidase [Candidatus Daviesbacteria bacterium]|nr:prepilin peptidase [Candidatus Daviesbacteria bacterium]